MIIATEKASRFAQQLQQDQITLRRNPITTLQVNIGKRCNQACHHCHVEAGPERTENMSLTTINRLLELVRNTPAIKTVDITGGAPELNPHFRYFIEKLRALDIQIIDRCNLTVLHEPGQENTARFLADYQINIVASLPCYLVDNVDQQRGKGVFAKSIAALQQLNQLGYGQDNSNLLLDLVYNPVGYHLPPAQAALQADYKRHLHDNYGIVFNRLFTITNMPIKRFAHQLQREGKYGDYMQVLIDNFNNHAAANVMCKNLLSIGWDGSIYDCDFNQMLDLPIGQSVDIHGIDSFNAITSDIVVADHCFGCTAGSGSSCGGTLV